MMKVNYFYISDEVHGRPIAETASSDVEGFKHDFHPTKLAIRANIILMKLKWRFWLLIGKRDLWKLLTSTYATFIPKVGAKRMVLLLV